MVADINTEGRLVAALPPPFSSWFVSPRHLECDLALHLLHANMCLTACSPDRDRQALQEEGH